MWYVGQKIICINDTLGAFGLPYHEPEPYLPIVKNKIYFIREIIKTLNPDVLGFRLHGIQKFSCLTGLEYNWDYRRFRPFDENDIDISVFDSILKNVNNKINIHKSEYDKVA